MGKSVCSVSLLMTSDWNKGLICQRDMLSARGTLTGCRNGTAGTSEFNKGKHKVLHLGRNNSRHWYMLEQPEISLAEKELSVLLPIRLNMSQEFVLVTKKASGILGCLRMSDASSLRKVNLPLHSALCSHS